IRFTLNSNLCIPGVLVYDGVTEIEVPLHKIPNAHFAEVGDFIIRIFLPVLRGDDRFINRKNPNYIGEEFLRPLYDLGFRPAAAARGERGDQAEGRGRGPPLLQQSSKPIPGEYVRPLLQAFWANVNEKDELGFAQGGFMVMEGKNFKYNQDSQHHAPEEVVEVDDLEDLPADDHSRTKAIRSLLGNFVISDFPQGCIYIDIAMTVGAFNMEGDQRKDYSLFANSQYHTEMINHFTEKPINDCERWVRTSSGGYSKNEEAHLGDLASLHVDLATPGNNRQHSLQIYHSSKAITYNVALQHKARRTAPYKVINDWRTEHAEHMIPLQESFRNTSSMHDVVVRFETRVEYEHYPFVHLEIPMLTLGQWMLHMKTSTYWGWKWQRTMSINNTLNRFFISPKRRGIRSSQLLEYGSLIIILCWMANALVNRPDEGGNWNEIHDSACVHTLRDGAVVPFHPLGIFYINPLILLANTLPRISSQRTPQRRTVLYLCSHKTMFSELRLTYKLQGGGLNLTAEAQSTTVGNTWNVLDYHGKGEDEVMGFIAQMVVRGEHRGNRQQLVTIDLAEDVPDIFQDKIQNPLVERYPSEEVDPEVCDIGAPPSLQVSIILHKFPSQIFAKAPNMKTSGEPWCSLNPYDADIHTFCKPELPDKIFSSYIHCGYTSEQWETTVKTYYPTLQKKRILNLLRTKPQGLSQLEAWQDWEKLLLDSSTEAQANIVKEARKYVNSNWRWLPWFTANHLWKTGNFGHGGSKKDFKGEGNGGPWIIFNPRFRSYT
ncbi:hypothetical protein FRC11_009581, partial [Ceratobasidium sp. 423]